LRKTPKDRAKFAEAKAQAKQELQTKKIAEEQQVKKERAKQQQNLDAINRRNRPPKINDPEIGGNVQELIRASQRYKDAGKWAKGGVVNASNGAFIEVQNKFSDRMLPNKKRTTRIY